MKLTEKCWQEECRPSSSGIWCCCIWCVHGNARRLPQRQAGVDASDAWTCTTNPKEQAINCFEICTEEYLNFLQNGFSPKMHGYASRFLIRTSVFIYKIIPQVPIIKCVQGIASLTSALAGLEIKLVSTQYTSIYFAIVYKKVHIL